MTLNKEAPKITWIHQIPLPDGSVTPGVSTPAIEDFGLPSVEVRNKRVLDIGCLDGLYTFYAESRGAAEVVSIDILDQQFGSQDGTYNTGSGYLWAHKCLNSKAKYIFPFSVYDVSQLGKFDVVYCMGVIYHLTHPMLAIEQLNRAMKMGGILVLESEVHATSSLFCHEVERTKKTETIHTKSLYQGFLAFIKLLSSQPRQAVRLAQHNLKVRMANSWKKSFGNHQLEFANDPTIMTILSIQNLEKMIDFLGFRIEKSIARGSRMTYHCKKVSEINSVYSGIEERPKPTITNVNLAHLSAGVFNENGTDNTNSLS